MKFVGLQMHHNEELSLPSRERGLKSIVPAVSVCYAFVAPFAGARIEISVLHISIVFVGSLPSRERGLKSRAPHKTEIPWIQSLPSRERGLKL